MIEYTYSAWFRNRLLEPGEEDYEWVAMFIVVAGSAEGAMEWGNHLAHGFARRSGSDDFLSSNVEPPGEYADCKGIEGMPRVEYGREVSDEYIGW